MMTSTHKNLLQIGEVAARSGASVRTVRYYLEEGFIEATCRSPGGFFLFAPETAETVFYIQKLKNAGLSLKDIKSIYQARRSGKSGEEASSKVMDILEEQKALVAQKIQDFQQLDAEIEAAIEIVRQCRGCSIQPSRENCMACRVIKRKKKLPLPVQAIL